MNITKILIIALFSFATTAAEFPAQREFPFLSHLSFTDPENKIGLSIEIEAENLKLTTIKEDDFSAYLSCFEDPAIYEPYGLCSMTREEHEEFYVKLLGKLQSGNPGNYYCIRLKCDPNLIIGFVILAYEHNEAPSISETIHKKNSKAEVAIAVLPAYQKRGYGTEALSSVISIFEGELSRRASEFPEKYRPDGITLFWALVNGWNFISQRLLKKLGFKISLSDDGCGQVELRRSVRSIAKL